MEKKKAIKILKRARNLISKGWCQHGAFARDKNNKEVLPEAKEAVKFCAIGALTRAHHENGEFYPNNHLSRLTLEKCFPSEIIHYNEYVAKDKRYILRLYDRAIKSLENS